MNTIDLILLIIAAVAFGFGCWKGIIRSLGVVVEILCSVSVARSFSPALMPVLSGWLPKCEDPKWIQIIAFLILFFLCWIICALIVRMIEKLFKAIMLGWLNRLLGGLLSIGITMFVVSIAFNIFNSLDGKHRILGQERVDESALYEPVLHFAPALFPALSFDEWPMKEKKGQGGLVNGNEQKV